MLKFKHFTVLLAIAFISHSVSAQSLQTFSGISAETMIQDSLISGCVTASNITTNGSTAFGAFVNSSSDFPFESGLIMASGPIENAEGPDDDTNAGGSLSTDSDPDLDDLVSYSINDATVIEFDFTPASDTIRFNYIFGSEEFPEFANSSFNDVFGFFVSGPGISGPYTNNAINIASLPNGSPVTIDNLYNTMTWYTGSVDPSSGGEGLAYNNVIQYDGASINLTAELILTACQTYHIKLAVGDAGDSSYDSGVFIESGSFTSGVEINAVNHSDVGTDADLYEGCENYFVLERSPNSPIDEEVVININYMANSTAEEGVDVSEIDDQAYIAPNTNSDTIWYDAFNDGLEEGTELMILEFWTSCPCGGSGGNSVIDTINIYDAESIKGGIQDVQLNYCGVTPPETLELVADVNIYPAYYEWSTGSFSNQITVEPEPGIQTYSLTISDVCGNQVHDSVSIRVSDMNLTGIDVEQVSCYNNCDGSMQINVENDFQPFEYIYGNADYFYLPDSLTSTYDPLVQNLCPGDYYVKIVDDIGCYVETEVEVPNKANINLSPGILNSSVNFCEAPGEITLTAEASIDDAIFNWFNGDADSTTTVTPASGENDYWVEISDQCGTTFEDHVIIRLSNLSVDANVTADTLTDGCGGMVSLFPSGGFEPYNYWWLPPLSQSGDVVEELCAGEYIFQLTDGIGCEYTDTVVIPASNSVAEIISQGLTIYPNPAKDFAFIDLSELPAQNAIISVYNITGKLVYTDKTTEQLYKTRKLPAGSYMLTVELPGKNHRYVDKLVITE